MILTCSQGWKLLLYCKVGSLIPRPSFVSQPPGWRFWTTYGNLSPGSYNHPRQSILLWGWTYSVKPKQFTCLNAHTSQVVSSRKYTIGLLVGQGQKYIPKLHTCSPFELPDHAGVQEYPNFLLISAEAGGAISGSLHPQKGDKNSHCQRVSEGLSIFDSYVWIILIPCLCLYHLVAMGKEVAHALLKDCVEGEKEEMNKLSRVCLLYVKALYKQQSTMSINIQSCRNATINACTKLLITGAAFTINALVCWEGGGGQTQKSGDLNSSLRFAACWSHRLRHTPKSVTSHT